MLCVCTGLNQDLSFAGTHSCTYWLLECGNLCPLVDAPVPSPCAVPLSQALVPCPLPHPGCSGHHWKAPFTTGATAGRLPMIQNVTSRLSQMVRLIHKGSPSHRSDPSEPQASFVQPLWVSFLSFGFLDPSATSATWLVSVSATHRCDQGQVPTLPWLHITFCKREIRRWLGPRAWHKGTSQER